MVRSSEGVHGRTYVDGSPTHIKLVINSFEKFVQYGLGDKSENRKLSNSLFSMRRIVSLAVLKLNSLLIEVVEYASTNSK